MGEYGRCRHHHAATAHDHRASSVGSAVLLHGHLHEHLLAFVGSGVDAEGHAFAAVAGWFLLFAIPP